MFSIEVPAELAADGHAHLCVVQTPHVAIDAIKSDLSRISTINILRDLLVGRPGVHDVPVLGELVPHNNRAIIILPEYALGSLDWATVDELVRTVQRPIVLIVGFGATAGKWIVDWHNRVISAGSPTLRTLTWDQNANPISNTLRVNGGWCWIHNFGGQTNCITFIKNNLEQSTEAVELAHLQNGRTLLHLKFQDVDLFPLICADLVKPKSAGAGVPQARISNYLNRTTRAERKILVTGSLLQPVPNINWEIAINDVVNGIATGLNSILVLVNQATGKPVADEQVDRWRSISGVFTRSTDLQKQSSVPAGRTLKTASATGMIVRESAPCAAAGPISWPPYNPVTDQFVWRPVMLVSLESGGIAHPLSLTKSIDVAEVERFTLRHPRRHDWSPRVSQGLSEVRQQISSVNPPDSKAILNSALYGVGMFCDKKYSEFNPDELGRHPEQDAFQEVVHALATLVTVNGIGWQRTARDAGQLRKHERDINILVWRDPTRNAREMRRLLGAWLQIPEEHPRLLVIGEGFRSQLEEGPFAGDRLDNFTDAPPVSDDLGVIGSLATSPDDYLAPTNVRSVSCMCLHRVSHVYMDYDATSENDRVISLQERLDAAF